MESLIQRAGVNLAYVEGLPETTGHPWRYETAHGPARVVASTREVGDGLWQASFAGQCLDRRYYEVVERSIPDGFDYRYAVLENRATGAAFVQPFFVVDQDIAAGLSSGFRRGLAAMRRVFPRFLKMRVLMAGCAAGEGALGASEPWAVEALRELFEAYAREAGAPVVVLKDLPAEYRGRLGAFEEAGYRRVPSMPSARLALDFASFDEFMQTRLSRVYRKGLRRKFRESERLGSVEMEVVDDLKPYLSQIHELYCQTYERSPFKFERLTRDYFAGLGERLPDRARFFLWRHRGRIVAFSCCLVHEGVLHDLNVGLDYSVALDLHLYFLTWRDLVTWAVGQGLECYHTGPLNYDPKLHLRMRLAPLDLYARHLSPWLNPLFGLALGYLQPARHDPVLRRFPNANEL